MSSEQRGVRIRPSQVCWNWLRGICRNGDACLRIHDKSIKTFPCIAVGCNRLILVEGGMCPVHRGGGGGGRDVSNGNKSFMRTDEASSRQLHHSMPHRFVERGLRADMLTPGFGLPTRDALWSQLYSSAFSHASAVGHSHPQTPVFQTDPFGSGTSASPLMQESRCDDAYMKERDAASSSSTDVHHRQTKPIETTERKVVQTRRPEPSKIVAHIPTTGAKRSHASFENVSSASDDSEMQAFLSRLTDTLSEDLLWLMTRKHGFVFGVRGTTRDEEFTPADIRELELMEFTARGNGVTK